jgi:hypothetical protein
MQPINRWTTILGIVALSFAAAACATSDTDQLSGAAVQQEEAADQTPPPADATADEAADASAPVEMAGRPLPIPTRSPILERPTGPVLTISGPGRFPLTSFSATLDSKDSAVVIPSLVTLAQSSIVTRPGGTPELLPVKIECTDKAGKTISKTFDVTGYFSAMDAVDWAKANCNGKATVTW